MRNRLRQLLILAVIAILVVTALSSFQTLSTVGKPRNVAKDTAR